MNVRSARYAEIAAGRRTEQAFKRGRNKRRGVAEALAAHILAAQDAGLDTIDMDDTISIAGEGSLSLADAAMLAIIPARPIYID